MTTSFDTEAEQLDPGHLGRMNAECSDCDGEKYADFLTRKLAVSAPSGFEPVRMESGLFPFQADLVAWALRRGRAAIFASTGLGKTRMQIEWARQVCAHASGSVLILAPLVVATQTVAEGASIDVPVTLCRDGIDVRSGINVTNYDRLHRFDSGKFVGVVLDESSCIKHYAGKTLDQMIAAFGRTPYRLCATATPAPNDYTELGTHAEFLGICTRQEMLAEFFCHDGGETQIWRLKGHARTLFWRWVASWGALVRTPADLGYREGNYKLPPLRVEQHILRVETHELFATGDLFGGSSKSLMERRDARKTSLSRRTIECAKLIMECKCQDMPSINAHTTPPTATQPEPCVNSPAINAIPTSANSRIALGPSIGRSCTCGASERWVVWCDFNAEQDALEELFGGECFSIYGSLDIDEKEDRLNRFISGERRILLGKPSIFGFGLNLQMCARMAFVGLTDSWEAYFQAVRRCWRFGQTRPVEVHVYASELEGAVVKNLDRKAADAERMAEELSAETADAVKSELRGRSRLRITTTDHKQAAIFPAWLQSRGA